MLEHPAGYVVARYAAGKRPAGALAAILTQVGALLLRRGWQGLLSDTRLLAPITEDEKAWVSTYWQGAQIPRPEHVDVAIVLSNDVFVRLGMSQLQVGVQPGNIRYKNFGNPEEAHAFLLRCAAEKHTLR